MAHRRVSQKNKQTIFFCFFTLHDKKQNKFVHLFWGESTARKSAYGFIWPSEMTNVGLISRSIYLFIVWVFWGFFEPPTPHVRTWRFKFAQLSNWHHLLYMHVWARKVSPFFFEICTLNVISSNLLLILRFKEILQSNHFLQNFLFRWATYFVMIFISFI